MAVGSSYSNYDLRASFYDQYRSPVGIGIFNDLLGRGEQHILDAGCGTGNYIKQLLPFVKKITGVDVNSAMLEIAKRKFASNSNVELRLCDLLERLPFEDNTFDGILVNQVLHHLDTDIENFPKMAQVIKELYRILKPGGFMAVNHCLPDQLDGIWYLDLLPRVKEELKRRYISIDRLAQSMINSGFQSNLRAVVFPDPLLGIHYFNLMGPLSSGWRRGHGVWERATSDEVEGVANVLMERMRGGSLGALFDSKDKVRLEKGQTIYIIGYKGGVIQNKQVKII